ncbi:His-Xaa-Ser system radical SAM maturase HxsC [Parapedobacter defluvii]|uniref:His-Xaa-Ser system radical SAM maturase HxsC n=1 Tax=Parapedobacter defluvii TaxID=2045106 RepID=UPI001E2CCFDC|nr:His-Xaa-Ser system radical SAM maturase HxsC [Parapedobacter defluvii]
MSYINAVGELVCFSPSLNKTVLLSTGVPPLERHLVIAAIPSLKDFGIGDILLISPNGTISSLFREQSAHNTLFITDRCNSNCLMCSQPPKNTDDLDYFFEINSQLIRMLPPDLKELGITGGEPTILGSRFITLLELITEYLPNTAIHILTNGRSFAWKNVAQAIQKVCNPNLVFGIPLYSDYYQQHDYIVQAKGAFNQTILGFHNMARYGQRLELRIVLHKQTYKRLPSLAKYIFMNLPFVEHIALMGLEYTGYTPKNSDLLWMEPSEYADELEEAVSFLDGMGLAVSIYNLQLCLLKPSLWKFARKSISDWKQEYLNECSRCSLVAECGGVFATSKKHSGKIKAIAK